MRKSKKTAGESTTTTVAVNIMEPGHIARLAKALDRIRSTDSPDRLVEEVASSVAHYFDAAAVQVYLWGDSEKELVLKGSHGIDVPAHGLPMHFPPGEGPLGAIAVDFQPRVSGLNVAMSEASRDWAKRERLHSLTGIPLLSGEKLIGILAAYTRRDVAADELAWINVYGRFAGVLLDDAARFEESRRTLNQLAFLVEASKMLNSTLDLGELLDIILKLATRQTGADRGTLYLVDRDRKEIWSLIAHGIDKQQEIRLPFGRGIAGSVAETGEMINLTDAYDDSRFNPNFDRQFGYRTRSLLCIPIRNRAGEIVSILQLLNKAGGPFTANDLDFLNALSTHVAIAIENARLHREVVVKQRMEKELALARGIQRSLLPEKPPVIEGFDIAVEHEPSQAVGGDYYDFLTMGQNTLLVVVADVEGKGVSSAMIMSNLQATLRALVMHLHALEIIMLSLNDMIVNDTKSQKYMTMFLGLVDTKRKGVHFINAGHVPPVVVRKTGDALQLREGGTVIGLFPNVDYTRGHLKLENGDIFLACTDGIVEAMDTNSDEYGLERLISLVQNVREQSANEIVAAILKDVDQFSKGGTHEDDKVMMVVKVL